MKTLYRSDLSSFFSTKILNFSNRLNININFNVHFVQLLSTTVLNQIENWISIRAV